MMLVPWLFADRFRFVCIRGLWVQAMKAGGRGGVRLAQIALLCPCPRLDGVRWQWSHVWRFS